VFFIENVTYLYNGCRTTTMKTPIIFSEKCLGYSSWHIESPQRIRKAQEVLAEKGYKFVEPQPASDEDLFGVHDADYIWNIKKGLVDDQDTPAYDNIFEYAKLSAGAACLAAKLKGFSLMRPPGHHAGRCGAALGATTRGFCYINNIDVAGKALDRNGTQEIFQGDPKVLYVSVHRHPHYPGTGNVTEGNCINYSLPADCGEHVYLGTLEKALSAEDLTKFEVVAVSAGFDTHAGDLASLGLTEGSYRQIGRKIAALGKPTFFVLEGGYRGEKNGLDIDQLLKGFEEEP
jgi:acetoin utilization deacetylase AcuC-like enzyme